jgi:hypothetical protein
MKEPNVGITSAIAAAARLTGVSSNYLTATAQRESAFDPAARSATSSAAGLYQFIESTWLSTLSRHGESLGIEDAGNLSRDEALALRFDPSLSALLAGALTADNAGALTSRLGRTPSDGELYAAHVLGAGGAADLIRAVQANPSTAAEDLFPAAARANRGLFYDGEGRPVSAAGLASKFNQLIGSATGYAAAEPPPVPALRAVSEVPASRPIRPVEGGARAVMLRGSSAPMALAPETIELLAQLDAPERARRQNKS